MRRSVSVFLQITTYVFTAVVALLTAWTLFHSAKSSISIGYVVCCAVGFISSWFIMSVIHEMGHVCFAKTNAFRIDRVTLFNFYFSREEGKFRLRFLKNSPVAGETVLSPLSTKDIAKRYYKATVGGICFTGFGMLLGLIILCTLALFPVNAVVLYCGGFMAMGLPAAFYYTIFNAIPFENDAGKSDGMVLSDLKKNTPSAQTLVALLKFRANLEEGNTPSQMEKTEIFDLPVISELDPLFASLQQIRYLYYIDANRYDDGYDCLQRLSSVYEELSDAIRTEIARDLFFEGVIRSEYSEIYHQDSNICIGDDLASYRLLAADAFRLGKREEARLAIDSWQKEIVKESCLGKRRIEEIQMERLKNRFASEN